MTGAFTLTRGRTVNILLTAQTSHMWNLYHCAVHSRNTSRDMSACESFNSSAASPASLDLSLASFKIHLKRWGAGWRSTSWDWWSSMTSVFYLKKKQKTKQHFTTASWNECGEFSLKPSETGLKRKTTTKQNRSFMIINLHMFVCAPVPP